jgi:hypothetical protein
MRLALLFFDGLSSWFLIIDLLKGSQYPGIGFNILEHATIVYVKEDGTKQNRNRSTIGFIKSGGTIKNRNFSTCGYVKSNGTIQSGIYMQSENNNAHYIPEIMIHSFCLKSLSILLHSFSSNFSIFLLTLLITSVWPFFIPYFKK